jgi:hypothetical protein
MRSTKDQTLLWRWIMSSKRNIRRKACDGKEKFDTHDEAYKKAKHIQYKYNTGFMAPYECQFCKKWHFGHPPKNIRNAIKRRGGL